MLVQGNVGLQAQPATQQAVIAAFGQQGDQIMSQIHGRYYNAARAGRVYLASTVIAGAVIPVAAATLNSKFTLHNPAGSGVMVEPIRCGLGIDSATIVVNCIGLAIQKRLALTGGAPTTVTPAAAIPLGPAGVNPVGVVYTQATLTNAAIPGVTAATAAPIGFYPMVSMEATATTGIDACDHNFNGALILEPDSLAAVCTSVAASTASFMAFVWAEWLI